MYEQVFPPQRILHMMLRFLVDLPVWLQKEWVWLVCVFLALLCTHSSCSRLHHDNTARLMYIISLDLVHSTAIRHEKKRIPSSVKHCYQLNI